MSYCVYLAVLPNDKVYVGQTSNFKDRQKNHYYKGVYFHNALLKYDNCTWTILHSDIETEELACAIEQIEIIKYKSNDKKYGYNLTEGGEGRSGAIVSDETRAKMSKVSKGRKCPEGTRLACIERNKKSQFPIRATYLNSGEIKEFSSLRLCADMLGLPASNICRVLKGQQGRTHVQGWVFEKLDKPI